MQRQWGVQWGAVGGAMGVQVQWECSGVAVGSQWGCGGVAVGLRWGCGGVAVGSDLRLSSSAAVAEGVAEGVAEAEGEAQVWPSSCVAWLRARAQPCASWKVAHAKISSRCLPG